MKQKQCQINYQIHSVVMRLAYCVSSFRRVDLTIRFDLMSMDLGPNLIHRCPNQLFVNGDVDFLNSKFG